MARMIPDQMPTDTPSVAERELFYLMREGLSDEYTVIHSLPWLDHARRNLQQGECDFLVLHPQHGMLSIETKSGEIRYESQTRSWSWTDGKPLKQDPFMQASNSSHALSKLLRRDVSGYQQVDPPFGHAVILPHADQLRGHFPPHVTPQTLILRPELDALQARIESILAHCRRKQGPAMSPTLFGRVIDRLLPEFQVVQSLSSQFKDQHQELARLTAQQIHLLNAMRGNRRLLVEGCAGSGKTLLALEKATRMAHEGARVLLICFNIPLANWLQQRVAETGAGVDVFHFHGLCEHVVQTSGSRFEVPADRDALSHFWNVQAPNMMFEGLDRFPQRYDAIIVDEGQDFSGNWWIPIQELLASETSSYFYIFHDPRQNIFSRENSFPFTEPSTLLDVNCRNTNRIARYVNDLVGVSASSADFIVDGLAPVEHLTRSDEEEIAVTTATLDNLISKERIDPGRIVIIGRHRFENSPYAGYSALNGVRLVNEVLPGNDLDAVRYATIYRFKGLEADCAILTGFDRPQVAGHSRELYVAASRARLLLHLMYRDSSSVSSD